MEIKDYNQETMSDKVKELFLKIYPDKPETAQKMQNIKNAKRLVSVKVAIENDLIVGQANVLLFENNTDIANLGYHIHPEFRKRGIATKLSEEIIKDAKNKGVKMLLIRTDSSNLNSIKVAEKLNFIHPSEDFLEKNKELIYHPNIKNITCLYKIL